MRHDTDLCPDEQAQAAEEAGRARAQNAQAAFFFKSELDLQANVMGGLCTSL